MENGPLQKAVLQLSKQDNEINEIIMNNNNNDTAFPDPKTIIKNLPPSQPETA